MKKIFVLIIVIMVMITIQGCKEEETPPVIKQYTLTPYITRGDKSELLTQKEPVVTQVDAESRYYKMSLDPSITYQEMDGFGAAMTESSAYLISQLSLEQQQILMNDLFGEEGIRIAFVRLPMGASDFALSNYSYNDLLDDQIDLTMEHFSIERDLHYVVPMLKKAFEINPQIKLLGSPWSAPAWMKTTKTMNGGSLINDYLDAYATYFVKFIQAYNEEGLNIYAVTPQNEPLHQTTNYPTMYMSAQQQLSFIIKLKEAFDQEQIETLIISYDHNWDKPNYPTSILASPIGYEAVAGSGFHCYGGNVSAQQEVQSLYPDKGIWFTECSGGGWATNFSDNMKWNMENVFIGSINYYAKGVLMWNLALDDNDGPTNGGCMNCRGVVTIHEDGTYTKNEEYYMIGHFSKFVDQGARRIKLDTNHTNLLATAFKNPDGKIIIVAQNKGSSTLQFSIEIDGSKAAIEIPGSSSVTYVLEEVETSA
ncbi:MAG: glycoside hydrolase family 30 beta sandwich domain-containing protein [Acholeplasmataceae bacterium]|jgi:glucosylceramidase|nr:glycoside hydrolase family 30 beta sandwich domain-containing protein [Acholeplasmataceae bacterium]